MYGHLEMTADRGMFTTSSPLLILHKDCNPKDFQRINKENEEH